MTGETADAASSLFNGIAISVALVFILLFSLPSSPSGGASSTTTTLFPTTTTLLCTPNTIRVGGFSTCTATVTTVGGPSPTGTVAFSAPGRSCSNYPPPCVIPGLQGLSSNSTSCSLAVTKSTYASCSITVQGYFATDSIVAATYNGDSNNAGSVGQFSIIIIAAPQTSESTASTTMSSSTSPTAAPSIDTRDMIMAGAVLVILGLSGFVFVTERRGKGSPKSPPQSPPPNELGGQLSNGARRLVAIMYTDMVGYTALTQSNEAQAMQMLDRHNSMLRPFFPRFHGREVKAIGDSFLVEFESALDALKCATEIQSYLHDNNVSSKEEWKVKLRIGIHLGDVIHREGDVFGDAVNIASRIYPIARPEGICISQQVYDQVQNKFDLPLVSLGEKTLKNVSKSVQVYSVQMPWESMDHIPRLET